MRLRSFLNEESIIKKSIEALKNKTFKVATKLFRDSWIKLVKTIEDNNKEDAILRLLNTRFKTNYTSLQQISKARIVESDNLINEDLKHFWETLKIEGFPVMSIFPGLQVWFEIDKLLFNTGIDFDMSKMIFYSLLWFLFVSGKFKQGWNRWRKENPEEWEKEGKSKNPFAFQKEKA